MKLLLASSSPYRKQQLQKIVSEFDCFSPDIDESSVGAESPDKLAERLSRQKAHTAEALVSDQDQPYLVIGSDQVAWFDNQQLHKPGNREANIEQLLKCQGQKVEFYTGLAVWNSATNETQSVVELYTVQFKPLSLAQIENYVDREQAFNCAGGFKSEGLGVSLFKKLEGDDPNSLIGLPMIKLVEMLEKEGYSVLKG